MMASEWQPIEANDPYNDESPVWVDENGCICWYAMGEVQRLILHEDARLCHQVEVPAAPAVPPDIAETLAHALDYHFKCEARLEYANGKITFEPDAFYQRICKAREWLAAQDTQGQEDTK